MSVVDVWKKISQNFKNILFENFEFQIDRSKFFLKFSFFKQFLPNFHKKMIHDIVKNSWVSWNHASYTPILVKNDNYTKSNFMHKWKNNLAESRIRTCDCSMSRKWKRLGENETCALAQSYRTHILSIVSGNDKVFF